jgi:hypothetical protein
MTEFTEDQELEIQKRIQKAREYEDERISFDQAFRFVQPYLQSITDQYDPDTNKLVKRGALDSFSYRIFMKKMLEVHEKYFPQPKAPEEKKPDGE